MKKYVDRDKLQEFTTKLVGKLKTMFSSPLVASTVAEMTDESKVYVYVGSESGYTEGNWYYYNGSVWTSGGVYNAVAVDTDKTLLVANQAADSKAAGDAIRSVQSNLTAETTARQSADTTLQNNINAERTRAQGEEARIEELFSMPTQEAVDNWLDEHPEATTTVEDNAVSFSKLNQSAYHNIGTMDNEFLKMGGVFGTTTDTQRQLNTQILSDLFTSYNGLRFISADRVIEVKNLTITLKNDSIIENVRLTCYGNSESVFIVSGTANRIKVDNANISNVGEIRYCFKLGSSNGTIYAPYSTFNHITISNFIYPFVLFAWNCAIGRMQFYNCTFGAILMGTSIDAQALYANSCLHGHCLGAFPTEEYIAQGNVYLVYSNIGILSTDSANDCECAAAFGNVRFCSISSLAYENLTKLKYVLYNYSTNYNPVVKITNLYASGTPVEGFILNKYNAKIATLTIERDFGEYLVQAYSNINNCNIYFINGSPYAFEFRGKKDALFLNSSETTKKEAQIKYSGEPLVNGGGSFATLRSYNTYGIFVGNITLNQSIKINLEHGTRSSSQSSSIPQRQHVLLAKLFIGDADQYNGTNIFGETLINFAIDSYTKDADYSSKLKVLNSIENLNISVDSSGDYPKIVIAPISGGTRKNYIYKLEILSGAITSIEVN